MERVVVHGGDEPFTPRDARIVPYLGTDTFDWGEDPRPRKRAAKARKRTTRRQLPPVVG